MIVQLCRYKNLADIFLLARLRFDLGTSGNSGSSKDGLEAFVLVGEVSNVAVMFSWKAGVVTILYYCCYKKNKKLFFLC